MYVFLIFVCMHIYILRKPNNPTYMWTHTHRDTKIKKKSAYRELHFKVYLVAYRIHKGPAKQLVLVDEGRVGCALYF